MINEKLQLASIVSAAILTLSSLTPAKSADTVTIGSGDIVSGTKIVTVCGMFEIDANAAGLTAAQRAHIVQNRLDHALINARDRSPAAVRVQVVNRNPVVTLDHFNIVTADGNSASRNRLSAMDLAEKWANSIRVCLADTIGIDKYLAMLTGNYPEKRHLGAWQREEIAVATQDILFPIKLVTPISAATANIGDAVEAVVSNDVPLLPSYSSYLPAGTVALGEIVDADKYIPNHFAGKNGFTVNFHQFRTPDGKTIPINGHILGSLDQWRMIHAVPVVAECCDSQTSGVNTTLTKVNVTPAKGFIVGSWAGEPLDEMGGNTDNSTRLVFSRRLATVVNAGEPMLLQLSGVTSMALADRKLFATRVQTTQTFTEIR